MTDFYGKQAATSSLWHLYGYFPRTCEYTARPWSSLNLHTFFMHFNNAAGRFYHANHGKRIILIVEDVDKIFEAGIDFSSVLAGIRESSFINAIFTSTEKDAFGDISRHSGWSGRLMPLYFPGYLGEQEFINQLLTIQTFDQPIDGFSYGCFSNESKLTFPEQAIIQSNKFNPLHIPPHHQLFTEADAKLIVNYIGPNMHDLNRMLDIVCRERISTLSAIEQLAHKYIQPIIDLLTTNVGINSGLILISHALFTSLVNNTYAVTYPTIESYYSNYPNMLNEQLSFVPIQKARSELERQHFIFGLDATSFRSLRIPPFSPDCPKCHGGWQYVLFYRRILAWAYFNVMNHTDVVQAKELALKTLLTT